MNLSNGCPKAATCLVALLGRCGASTSVSCASKNTTISHTTTTQSHCVG